MYDKHLAMQRAMSSTGGGPWPEGYMHTTAGSGVIDFSRLIDARVKCVYCGRRQIPAKSGSCCGCGANLP